MTKLEKLKADIKKARRREFHLRLCKYFFMTTATLVLMVFLVVRVTGNRWDLSGRTVKPTGLVKLAAKPAGVQMLIDEVDKTSLLSNNEFNLDIGGHSIKMVKAGYRDWSKQITINQGQVLWLDYAVLLPNQLNTESVANVHIPAEAMTKTRDNKWALVQYPGFNRFALLRLSNLTNIAVTDFSLPEGSLAATDPDTAQELKAIHTDSSSRYFLLQHTFVHQGVTKAEYLVVDRKDPAAVQNLSSPDAYVKCATVCPQIEFEDAHTNAEVYYIDNDGTLRLSNHNAPKGSAVELTRRTSAFSQYERKVITITQNPAEQTQTVGVTDTSRFGASAQSYYLLKNFPASVKLQVFYVNYYAKDYAIISDGAQVYVIADPLGSPSEEVLPLAVEQIDWLKVSANGRVILAGHDSSIISYDQETKSQNTFQIAPAHDGATVSRPLFLDEFHLYVNDGQQVWLMDFDGDNPYPLAFNGSALFFSHDQKYLFSLSQDESGQKAVQRTDLTI